MSIGLSINMALRPSESRDPVAALAQTMDWLVCFNAYDPSCVKYQEAAKSTLAVNPTDPVGAVEKMYGADYDLTAGAGEEASLLADGSIEFTTGQKMTALFPGSPVSYTQGVVYIMYSRSDVVEDNGVNNQRLFGGRRAGTSTREPSIEIRNNTDGFIIFPPNGSSYTTGTSGILLDTPLTHLFYAVPDGGATRIYINGNIEGSGVTNATAYEMDGIALAGGVGSTANYWDHGEVRFFGVMALNGTTNTLAKALQLEALLRSTYG